MDKACFCWYRGNIFVAPIGSTGAVIDHGGVGVIIAILLDGGVEISEETAREMGWNLY